MGNRGKSPSELVKMKLCAVTGGRCQFCNKFLFTDSVTLEEINDSNIAHIIASSPDGPRGGEKSHELSDKIENLMLLCLEHHQLIDKKPDIYTVEFLQELKTEKEKAYAMFSNMQNLQKTNIVIFRSKIKGVQQVNYNLTSIIKSFLLEKIPEDSNGIEINLLSKEKYSDKKYWSELTEELEYKFDSSIIRILERNPEAHFSVFPIGPIPLIIKLGYAFGDKLNVDIYQKFREPDSWSWVEKKETNQFYYKKHTVGDKKLVALVISLTADISEDRVFNANNDIGVIYTIAAQRKGVDCILSKMDLRNFWVKYQEVCEEIRRNYKDVDVHLFSALPVSAAFEIGRRFMPGVYNKMKIYEENEGFFETITIGE